MESKNKFILDLSGNNVFDSYNFPDFIQRYSKPDNKVGIINENGEIQTSIYYPAWLKRLLNRFFKPNRIDSEEICEIIKTGKENDVDEMKIILPNETVIGIDVEMPGVTISKTSIGIKRNTYKQIEIKYK